MRRLQKPVWMRNSNGEPHGLRKKANQKDWAIRMQQFFDFYLKGAPAPVWMIDGVPAIVEHLVDFCEPGDVVLVMSNGGFDDIWRKLLGALRDAG